MSRKLWLNRLHVSAVNPFGPVLLLAPNHFLRPSGCPLHFRPWRRAPPHKLTRRQRIHSLGQGDEEGRDGPRSFWRYLTALFVFQPLVRSNCIQYAERSLRNWGLNSGLNWLPQKVISSKTLTCPWRHAVILGCSHRFAY